VAKLNSHIELIQGEINKNLDAATEVNPDFEFIIQEEIPKL
jgi:hypothetical protein